MADPTVITESLGGSALSRAARAGQLPQWYRVAPRGGEWRGYAEEVRASVGAQWFDDLAPAFDAKGAAAARLQRSAGGKGIVITTGQQPGLYGGALMTFVKALAARALADVLQESLGMPVAPVFWAATDDADFDEAAVVSVALEGGARELRLTQRGPTGTPMARTPLVGGELEPLAALLGDACGSIPHTSPLDTALRCYRDGVTVGDAYVGLLRELLEPLEIPVLDASHPVVSRAMAPVLQRAAHESATLAAATDERSDAILAAGFVPQVEQVDGLSLVFSNVGGVKRRLTLREAESFTGWTDAEYLSPTVLVRPVAERTILPTAAYLGGPGEVAYFAQVNAVAAGLGVPTPLVLPRWSATIIEPRIQQLLDELGTTAADLADPHAVEGRIARLRAPTDAMRALASARAHLTSDVDALKRATSELTPPAVIDGVQKTISHRLERLERRLLAAVKRHEAEEMRKIATARGALFPHGVRQERKLSFVPFLARYGPGLVEQMLDAARAHARSLVAGTPAMAAAPSSAPASV